MAEFNEEQTNFYNSLISQNIDAQTANDLTTGKLSAADYKASLEKNKTNTQEEMFEAEGYDVKLMTETKAKIAKKTKQANEGAASQDISQESIYLADYKPSKKDIVKSYGINADIDNELPKGIRLALGLGIANEDLAVIDAKKLYKKYLIEDKEYDKDLVESLDEKLQFKYQELPDPSGKGKTRVFTYRVPEELGGTNKWTVTNSPTILPTAGDLAAIAGDVGVVAAAVGGGIAGSTVTPIIGTAIGSATATGLAELTKLYTGRLKYDLASGLDDDKFFDMAIKQAALTAGIDLIATPAFLVAGQSVKKMFMTAAMDKISPETIENMIKSGKFDDNLMKNLDEAKAILKDNGISEELADEYLAVNVAKAFKNPALKPKDDAFEKITFSEGEEMAKKSVRISEVERKLIKRMSGLDDVNISSGQKDEIINDISARIRSIRQTELDDVAAQVKLAEGKVDVIKKDLLPDPEISYIDNIGITFNDLTQGVKKQLSFLEKKIDSGAKKNNIRVDVKTKDSVKILNTVIKDHNEKLIKKMKVPDKKNGLINNKEYMKEYQANQYVKTMEETLAGYAGRGETVSVSQILKDGLKSLENMSFKQAVTWRAILRGAEKNKALPQPVLDSIRKVKGAFNESINDATSGNLALANDVAKFDSLMVNYRGSFLNQLADEIGAGPGKAVTSQIVGRVGKNRSIFETFVNSTNESVDQAFRLKNLIDSNQLSVSQINKINNSLYENYFNKVVPKKTGGLGVETHDEFIKKYGENYQLILGNEKYSKFVKSNKDALKVMDDAVAKQIAIRTSVSEALPGMPVNILDNGVGTSIVDQLLTKMKSNDVTQLIKNLSKSQDGLAIIKETRQIMVFKMLNDSYLTNSQGQVLNGRINGIKLDEFLTDNKEILDQLFSKEFTSTFRQVSSSLRLLQDDSLLGSINALSLKDAATTAGQFIDIFAGPLNHKRLVVNRLATLFEKFKMGGDNINLLMDYKMAIEAAKKNALGGNYNLIFDTLGKSNKPVYRSLLTRLRRAIYSKDSILGYKRKFKGINSQTLLTKEYLKEKSNIDEKGNQTFTKNYEDPMPDEPDVFTAVDNVLSSLGKNAKNEVITRTGRLLTQFKDAWFKDEGLNVDYKEQEFNKKLK